MDVNFSRREKHREPELPLQIPGIGHDHGSFSASEPSVQRNRAQHNLCDCWISSLERGGLYLAFDGRKCTDCGSIWASGT